jgi:hypothetical protein
VSLPENCRQISAYEILFNSAKVVIGDINVARGEQTVAEIVNAKGYVLFQVAYLQNVSRMPNSERQFLPAAMFVFGKTS